MNAAKTILLLGVGLPFFAYGFYQIFDARILKPLFRGLRFWRLLRSQRGPHDFDLNRPIEAYIKNDNSTLIYYQCKRCGAIVTEWKIKNKIIPTAKCVPQWLNNIRNKPHKNVQLDIPLPSKIIIERLYDSTSSNKY